MGDLFKLKAKVKSICLIFGNVTMIVLQQKGNDTWLMDCINNVLTESSQVFYHHQAFIFFLATRKHE